MKTLKAVKVKNGWYTKVTTVMNLKSAEDVRKLCEEEKLDIKQADDNIIQAFKYNE